MPWLFLPSACDQGAVQHSPHITLTSLTQIHIAVFPLSIIEPAPGSVPGPLCGTSTVVLRHLVVHEVLRAVQKAVVGVRGVGGPPLTAVAGLCAGHRAQVSVLVVKVTPVVWVR